MENNSLLLYDENYYVCIELVTTFINDIYRTNYTDISQIKRDLTLIYANKIKNTNFKNFDELLESVSKKIESGNPYNLKTRRAKAVADYLNLNYCCTTDTREYEGTLTLTHLNPYPESSIPIRINYINYFSETTRYVYGSAEETIRNGYEIRPIRRIPHNPYRKNTLEKNTLEWIVRQHEIDRERNTTYVTKYFTECNFSYYSYNNILNSINRLALSLIVECVNKKGYGFQNYSDLKSHTIHVYKTIKGFIDFCKKNSPDEEKIKYRYAILPKDERKKFNLEKLCSLENKNLAIKIMNYANPTLEELINGHNYFTYLFPDAQTLSSEFLLKIQNPLFRIYTALYINGELDKQKINEILTLEDYKYFENHYKKNYERTRFLYFYQFVDNAQLTRSEKFNLWYYEKVKSPFKIALFATAIGVCIAGIAFAITFALHLSVIAIALITTAAFLIPKIITTVVSLYQNSKIEKKQSQLKKIENNKENNQPNQEQTILPSQNSQSNDEKPPSATPSLEEI